MPPRASPITVNVRITHTVNVQLGKASRGYFSDTPYVVTKYVIEVRWITEQKRSESAPRLEWQVARRYSHFRSNHLTLQSMFSQLRLPKLPPKKLQTSSTPDPELVAKRMGALDNYLKQLLAMPAVCCCTQLLTFLGAYHGMNPCAFTAPPPPSSLLGRRSSYGLSRKSSYTLSRTSTSLTGAWDAAALDGGSTFSESGLDTADGEGEGEESSGTAEAPTATDPLLLEARALIRSLGLHTTVDDFAANFGQLGYAARPDAAAGMTQRFLNGLEAAGAVEGGAECFDEALWLLRDELEDQLMARIYSQTFGVLPQEVEEDALLASRLASLSELQPAQLGVADEFVDTRFNRWEAARAELQELCACATPRAKMACVMRFVLQLKQGLLECKSIQSGWRGENSAFGADELFPVLVYVVLRANPPQLHSNLQYVQRFRSPMGLKSEAGCYFTHLQAAASFLSSLAEEPAAAAELGVQPGTADDGTVGMGSNASADAAGGEGAPGGSPSRGGAGFKSQGSSGLYSSGRESLRESGRDSSSVMARQRTASLMSAVDAWERQVESFISEDLERGTPRPSVDLSDADVFYDAQEEACVDVEA